MSMVSFIKNIMMPIYSCLHPFDMWNISNIFHDISTLLLHTSFWKFLVNSNQCHSWLPTQNSGDEDCRALLMMCL